MSRTEGIAANRTCKTPTSPGGQVITTPRYAAAVAALAQCWDERPGAFSPERTTWEAHAHKDARAEVRAAWIEAAQLHGIEPDKF